MSNQFRLGTVTVTGGVNAALDKNQVRSLVARHATGALGRDREYTNGRALRQGELVFSEFPVRAKDSRPSTVWILTNENRTQTLVMLPRESPYRASDLEEVRGPLRALPWPEGEILSADSDADTDPYTAVARRTLRARARMAEPSEPAPVPTLIPATERGLAETLIKPFAFICFITLLVHLPWYIAGLILCGMWALGQWADRTTR